MDTEQKNRRRPPQADNRQLQRPPQRRRPAAGPENRRPPVKKRRRVPQEMPEVIYEPAKPMTRRRLMIQLTTVVAVVLALVFGLSIFFKVDTITVSGADKYSAWTVTEASGIKKGDSLLSFGKAAACGRIQTNLPYVKNVRIGIKLPNTVNIEIEEAAMGYAMEAEDGTFWLMTADGKIIEQIPKATEQKLTRVEGITLAAPVGKQAVAAAGSGEDAEALAEVAARRLETVLEILKNLEKNEILGQVDSLDVTNPEDLTMEYEGRYRVRLGNGENLEKKIHSLHLAIGQMSRYQSGTLDVSFTTRPDQVMFTPEGKS